MTRWTYPIVAQFVNGNVFYLGIAMTCLACVIPVCSERARPCLRLCLVLGLLLMVLSATPLPIWMYAVFISLALSRWLLPSRKGIGWALTSALALQGCLMIGIETRYHLRPIIPRPQDNQVFIIGDSLSMWADRPEQNWPGILGERTGLKVHNFSFGGARARTALSNAERVNTNEALVILEMGGNDILGGTPPSAFRADLEHLLVQVCKGNHHVVMLELPLPPFCNRYGKVQRDLARRFGATLIPKRYLTAVLATAGATEDGLHLSPEGHVLLAETVRSLIADSSPTP